MKLLARLNVFWLGAGGFLCLFCANEIVANHLSRAPVWLGGRMVYVACWVGLTIGLVVMAFLGIEEPPEADAEGPIEPRATPPGSTTTTAGAPANNAADPGPTPRTGALPAAGA